jgi:hypothetical protein
VSLGASEEEKVRVAAGAVAPRLTLTFVDTTVPLSNLLKQKFKLIYECFALEK